MLSPGPLALIVIAATILLPIVGVWLTYQTSAAPPAQ